MRIKSYFASTVDAALNEARREMGPEAILIESRRASAESRRLGAYEVVCAVAAASGKAGVSQSPASTPGAMPPDPPGRRSQEVSAFLDRLDGLMRSLRRSEASALRLGISAETSPLIDMLEDAEVDPNLIRDLLSRATEDGHLDLSAALHKAIVEITRTDASLGSARSPQKIVAVVGPPGAGKTTTLVKLAARYGVGAKKPSLILSADTQRVGASESLRAYAAILGAGFRALETPKALSQTLEEFRGKERWRQDWIWIDTPGFCRKEMDDARELQQILANEADIDTHLVLSAPLRTSDLSSMTDQFRPFRPSKLLFTHLDETETYGGLLNACAQTGLPLSFLAAGPQIPEDLEEASPQRVAQLILHGTLRREFAAIAAA